MCSAPKPASCFAPVEPKLCLGLCFYFPSLAFLPTFSSSCLGSSETMSHSCSPLALSGPYPTPRHYVTSLPSPLTITPATISLPWSLCSLSSCVPAPAPIPCLNAVDPGLTVTPGSWLVRKASSPQQPRLESDTLGVGVSDLFIQVLQMMPMLSKLRTSVVDYNKMAPH